jgi:hypothetical protein
MSDTDTTELQTFQPDFDEEAPDSESLLMARIPLLSGSVNKVHYLSWRAMGFEVREACQLSDIKEATVRRWRVEDEDFAEWEGTKLRELQKSISQDILRFDFMRNMRMAMSRDSQILFKAACDLHELTEREYDYLKKIRGYYTPSALIELDRATAPELTDEGAVMAQLTVKVGANEIKDEHGRRAAARSLLEQFRVTTEVQINVKTTEESVDGDIIEGKAKVPEEVSRTTASTFKDPV